MLQERYAPAIDDTKPEPFTAVTDGRNAGFVRLCVAITVA